MVQDNLTQGNRTSQQVPDCRKVSANPKCCWVGFDFPSVKNTVALGGQNEMPESQTHLKQALECPCPSGTLSTGTAWL